MSQIMLLLQPIPHLFNHRRKSFNLSDNLFYEMDLGKMNGIQSACLVNFQTRPNLSISTLFCPGLLIIRSVKLVFVQAST